MVCHLAAAYPATMAQPSTATTLAPNPAPSATTPTIPIHPHRHVATATDPTKSAPPSTTPVLPRPPTATATATASTTQSHVTLALDRTPPVPTDLLVDRPVRPTSNSDGTNQRIPKPSMLRTDHPPIIRVSTKPFSSHDAR